MIRSDLIQPQGSRLSNMCPGPCRHCKEADIAKKQQELLRSCNGQQAQTKALIALMGCLLSGCFHWTVMGVKASRSLVSW